MQRKSLTIKCPIDSLYEMIPTKFPLFSLYTKNRHQISCFSYAVGTLVLVVSGLQNFEKNMVALRFIYTARKRTRKWIVSLIFVAAQCEQYILDSLWTHLEVISLSLSLQFQWTLTKEAVQWFLPVLVVLVRFRREFGCGFGSARRWAPRGCWAGWAHCACPAVTEPAPPRSARSPPPCQPNKQTSPSSRLTCWVLKSFVMYYITLLKRFQVKIDSMCNGAVPDSFQWMHLSSFTLKHLRSR